MQVIYVTSNSDKFEIATSVLRESDITLIQRKMDLPEIQSLDVAEVAMYSGQWARDRLNAPVVVTDIGLYIHALNGYPGPFVKYANSWLTAEEILSLIRDKDDRTVIIRECLAYCEVGCNPIVFQKVITGVITHEIKFKNGSVMDQLVIPDGCDFLLSELTGNQVIQFWSKHSAFTPFKDWFLDKAS